MARRGRDRTAPPPREPVRAAAPAPPAAVPPPGPGAALTRVALQLGATSVVHADVAAMLSHLCESVAEAAGVEGAALLLREPADPRDPGSRQVFGSGAVATRLGELQRRAGSGPGPAAERGDRTLVTPDLTRSGPPELAAAAADCGLTRSLSVPVPPAGVASGDAGHGPVGVLQLFDGGLPDGPLAPPASAAALPDGAGVAAPLTTPLWPVVATLAARLADLRALAAAESSVGHATTNSGTAANGSDTAARSAESSTPAATNGHAARVPAARPEDDPESTVRPEDDPESTVRIPAARDAPPEPGTGTGPGTPLVPAPRRARHRRED
ncbi:hypothetical protein [Pseudonocardia phyllosphaerae]|uniref:hypothetical protein n=1 Tax=Pseudonocardia phyllosphaerae TaxID=3390502 RepID=UPI00397D3B13